MQVQHIRLLFIFLLFSYGIEAHTQEIVVNADTTSLNSNDIASKIVYADLSQNQILKINIINSNSTHVKIGEFESTIPKCSIEYTYKINGKTMTSELTRYKQTQGIKCLEYEIQLGCNLSQLTLDVYGGYEAYTILIKNRKY
jgi:hypothetical protein